jgi:hypothetical protein
MVNMMSRCAKKTFVYLINFVNTYILSLTSCLKLRRTIKTLIFYINFRKYFLKYYTGLVRKFVHGSSFLCTVLLTQKMNFYGNFTQN